MVTTVTASEAQRNFGALHDDALQEPVQITKHGRETVYVVSARMWHELWASYRIARPVEELTDEELEDIRNFPTGPDADYGPEDHPEVKPSVLRP